MSHQRLNANQPSKPKRIALGIEYLGSGFLGWQRQKKESLPSIQSLLETALSRVANEPIAVVAAGRTDAGVHATEQIIHFDTHALRKPRDWVLGGNCYLPEPLSILWAKEVSQGFHARYSAIGRTYRYLFGKGYSQKGLHYDRMWLLPDRLDVELMKQAAEFLLGEHDFSAFRASECQANSPIRQVFSSQVIKDGATVIFEIEANGFLHHMVRNIVGTLIFVGRTTKYPAWIKEVLLSRNRSCAGVTAPSCGLYLHRIRYPKGLL